MLRAAVLLAAVSLGSIGVPNETLTVSAAVSLTDVMDAIGRAYAAAGGDRVTFNFGASNILARQIVNGAPVDVFISADEAQMDVVAQAAMVEAGSRLPIVQNQLAIVVRSDWKGQLTDASALAGSEIRRIAVGDPMAVPAGVYAKQYLERVGLWSSLQPKLLPAASVRGALVAVESGAADAGIVYTTDAQRSRGVRLAFAISGPDAPRIVYPACTVRTSGRKAAARKFLTFLTSQDAGRIFRDNGFRPAADSR
jgi:molybdate transport system substrate-binding protein